MATFNYATREVTAKVVYYGPGLSGKTASVLYMHKKIGPKNRGNLLSLATETDRTLFFDFFPVEFGQIGSYKIKFNFYTVPGQAFYKATRKLVMKGVDGVVFVADSQADMMSHNLESLEDLKENLRTHQIDSESVPFVIQYNKRDLPGVLPVKEMQSALNPRGAPEFETSAITGVGVMEAMKSICGLVIEDYRRHKAPSQAGVKPPPVVPPPPAGAPQPAAAGGDAPGTLPAGAERTFRMPLAPHPGEARLTLTIPLDVRSEAVDAGAELAVTVRVHYVNGTGQVVVRDLDLKPATNRGFWARLLGRG